MRAAKQNKCHRCGRLIPRKRREVSDYCTDRCARQQQVEDEASAKSERAIQERDGLHE